MPGGDGTGPAGAGPMTGRAAGYCAGYPVRGRRSGKRRVMWGAPYHSWSFSQPFAAQTKQQKLEMLRSQARGLRQAAEEAEQRISELAGETDAAE